MQGPTAGLALCVFLGLAAGGLALLQPATPPPAPHAVPSRSWAFPGEDAGGPWAGEPPPGRARIAVVARNVVDGRRISAMVELGKPDGSERVAQGRGLGPWYWHVEPATALVLRASAGGYFSAVGIVQSPPLPGGIRTTTAWLAPEAALINGRVLDGAGRRVAGAEVALELPVEGDGALPAMRARLRDSAVSVRDWRHALHGNLMVRARTGDDGYFTLSALPGQQVRVVVRTPDGKLTERSVWVARNLNKLGDLMAGDTPIDWPAPDGVMPDPQGEPAPGFLALRVRGPGGEAVRSTITLSEGAQAVQSMLMREGWLELRVPSRRQFTLTVEPGRPGLRAWQAAVRLYPDDRLWIGTVQLAGER